MGELRRYTCGLGATCSWVVPTNIRAARHAEIHPFFAQCVIPMLLKNSVPMRHFGVPHNYIMCCASWLTKVSPVSEMDTRARVFYQARLKYGTRLLSTQNHNKK